MKSFISLFAVAALSLITSARAQEESPSPSPAEDRAAPMVEAPSSLRDASPSPTPEEKPTPSATPTEKKEKAAAKSASPAAEKKEESKAATKKEASAADTGSPESNVKRLEAEWEAAVKKHDASFLQERIADDFLGCSSKGKRTSKSSLLKEFKGDTDDYTTAKNGGVAVRSFGPNVVIATGTSKEAGKSKDGKSFSKTFAWTDTWMMRDGKWRCIGSQAMLVSSK